MTCMSLVVAHAIWASHAGPINWYENVVKSHEYHTCLAIHSCMPDKIVEYVRSEYGCRELVISPGTEQERRFVR